MKLVRNFLAISALALVLVACTVTPKRVQSTVPSFDGTNQNSGFIGYAPDGRGIISPGLRERYSGLAGRYGGRFTPVLTPDAGIQATASNAFLIDQEHLSKLIRMSVWKRQDGLKDSAK